MASPPPSNNNTITPAAATSSNEARQLPAAINSPGDDDDDEENRVVESDPTGRFSRYAQLLGKGAYKEVYKGFDEDEGVEVAWNQLRVDHLAKREAQRILSEIQILQSLRNENIITMYHAWGAKGPDGRERVFFITELMTAGTLKSYLRKSVKGQATRLPVLKKWCRQILSGLAYLHTRDPPIIHRDLKCENIFMNGYNGQAKIGDLGLAIPKSRDHASSVLGTPEFMAPELYDENYDEKVDIYAFGMVVLEMVTKEYPYSECNNQYQIYKKVTSGVRPLSLAKITDEYTIQFIEHCIQFNPNLRPSAAELLTHPFLKLPESISIGTTPPGTSVTGTPTGSDAGMDSVLVAIGHRKSEPVLGELYTASPHQSISRAAAVSLPTAASAPSLVPPSAKESIAHLDLSNAGRSSSVASATSVDSRTQLGGSISPTIPLPHTSTTHTPMGTPPSSNPPSISGGPSATNLSAANSAASLASATAASAPPATVTIELIDRHSENTVTLCMIYTSTTPGGFGRNEIKFPFNLPDDTATDVVSEMARESLIEARDEVFVRRKLEEKVKNILLGRVVESDKRRAASEVPAIKREAVSGDGENTSLRDNVRGVGAVVGQEGHFATMPRLHGEEGLGKGGERGYASLPRASSSVGDLPFAVIPRSGSNSSISSGTSSVGGGERVGHSNAATPALQMPHITPTASPLLVKKGAVAQHSQLQQVASIGDRKLGGTSSAPPSTLGVAAAPKATFSLSNSEPAPPPPHHDEPSGLLPMGASSMSEGYKRGVSGSSVASSDYGVATGALSTEPLAHLRRPSHMSHVSDTASQWGYASGTSESGSIPPVRPQSAASVGSVGSIGASAVAPVVVVAPLAVAAVTLVAYGPVNNPALNPPTGTSTTPPSAGTNAVAASVQQRLLELQERSLNDLKSSCVSSNAAAAARNSVTGSAAPHINHHAVHSVSQPFHPHHAPGNGFGGGVRSTGAVTGAVGQSQLGVKSGSGTPMLGSSPNLNSLAGRPMGAGVAPVVRPGNGGFGTTTGMSSASLGNVGTGGPVAALQQQQARGTQQRQNSQ
ncbi:hypothetical protein HDU98_001300 [Podochytrium sp. JEL0797]|nr:hypothetical protein HDU98_001300 [Podochytrium sp. JEL0797]